MSRVYLIDDDTSFRESLAEIMKSDGLACTDWDAPESLLECYRLERPGCIVLDYRLTTLSGIEVLRKVREYSSIPIVIISAYADVPLTVLAMQAGAAAVFEKPLRNNEFLDFVKQVCYADREVTVRTQACQEIQKAIRQLSVSEREVLELMKSGLSNKVIAARLSKSVKAVERNRQTLLVKLKCSNAQEALLRVFRCPLVVCSPLACRSTACSDGVDVPHA